MSARLAGSEKQISPFLMCRSDMRACQGQKCRQHPQERYAAQGEVLLDAASKTTPAVAEEYAHYTEGTWSSKGMLELIRQKMSAAALDSDDRPSTSTSSPLGRFPYLTLQGFCAGHDQVVVLRGQQPLELHPKVEC